jgi:hypothetical protein
MHRQMRDPAFRERQLREVGVMKRSAEDVNHFATTTQVMQPPGASVLPSLLTIG